MPTGIYIRTKEHNRKVGDFSRGKTWEQRFGKEKAVEMKKKNGKRTKNKTYEELYGKERAEEMKRKSSESRKGKLLFPNQGKYIRTKEILLKSSESHKRFYNTSRGMELRNHKGEKNPIWGKHHTKKTRKKQSEAQTGEKNHNYGKPLFIGTKRKMRISAIKYLEECKLNGLPLTPKIGKNEKIILEELEKVYHYKIIHQFKIESLGYFIDGYIPELNLAIEIDEDYHKKRLKEDKRRQKEIEKELNCKFIRIKDY